MEQAIRKHRLFLRPKAAAFFARSMVDMASATVWREPTAKGFDDARWPALHINVAPEGRDPVRPTG
jgi:hypothetical protein